MLDLTPSPTLDSTKKMVLTIFGHFLRFAPSISDFSKERKMPSHKISQKKLNLRVLFFDFWPILGDMAFFCFFEKSEI